MKIPDTPGVYFFRNARKPKSTKANRPGKILYIGKATSLRDRVRSYFGKDMKKTRGQLIVRMIKETKNIDFIQTDSVLEALLLEAHLIKKHSPRYNTEGKDDKSFNYVVITKEDFPRVLIVRGKDLNLPRIPKRSLVRGRQPTNYNPQAMYGPFPQGGVLKEAIKIIRKMFPFRDKCTLFSTNSGHNSGHPMSRVGGKPCFNRQIGLCPGVCTGEISKKDYARTIQHLKLFFEGKKSILIKKLKKEMNEYAKKQEFEKANAVKKTIFTLNHIQDIALLKQEKIQGRTLDGFTFGKGPTFVRVEGYDVAHISGTSAVGVMVVIENGEIKKSDYRKFRIKGGAKGNDIAALKEVLWRRFEHGEWRLPNLIVVDGGVAQKNVALRTLKEYGFQIPVVSVVKDEHHRPREILGDKRFRQRYEKEILLANNEAHRFALAYHRKVRSKLIK